MTEPLISVILPVYNMEAYLSRCLDSVLNNTYHNLEVICIDDGSRDASLEILHRYEENDSRVIVISKENGGVSSARNAGLNRATGEYVCFVDSDDYVHPQYFELLFRALRESGLAISVCQPLILDSEETDETSEAYTFDPDALSVCSVAEVFKTENLMAFCWGKLIRSSLVKDCSFDENLGFAEDTVFFAEVCRNETVKQVAVLSYSLYYYVQREGSAVKNADNPQFLSFSRVWLQQLQKSQRDDIYLDKALKWNLSKRYISRFILPDRKAAREFHSCLKAVIPFLRKTQIYGAAKKALYLLFIFFPRIYRLHRIFGEKGMWEWEQWERKKRREARKSERKGVTIP